MGPSPPPSSAPAAPPSLLQDWFFRSAADRDTQILIQALTHELSTPPACHQSLCAPPESGFAGPDSLPVLKALEEQHVQRHHRFAGLGKPPVSTSGSQMAMVAHGLHIQEGLLVRENGCMQAASPPSSSSLPASNPGSPYSTITTTSNSMSIPTDAHALVIHAKSAGMAPEGLLVNALTSTDACIHPNSSSLQLYRSSAAPALSMRPIRSCKAGKRRTRATSRSPIHVLSTDVSNFRAIVQQLTGIPSTFPVHRHANSSMMNPPPFRNPHPNAAILPTLDTSAALLRSKPPVKDPLQGFSFTRKNGHQASGYLSSVGYGAQSTQSCDVANPPAPSSGISLHVQQSILNDQSRLSPSSPTLSSIWNYENDAKLEGDFPCFVQAQQFSTKQAMPPLDELAPMKAHYSAGDSWLFFDGVIANQAPHLEIARMA